MYPAQGSAVLVKDLVTVGISLTQRGMERTEGVAVDFAAWTNSTLGSGTHCRCVQVRGLYFEKTGTPLLREGHHGQRTGFRCPPAPFPVRLGRAKVGVV